jgi:hypothetical protein
MVTLAVDSHVYVRALFWKGLGLGGEGYNTTFITVQCFGFECAAAIYYGLFQALCLYLWRRYHVSVVM